jgi:oligopeptide transport system substrate-binding protein
MDTNEPQNPLEPAITNEVGGGLVMQNLFAAPVYYKADGSIAMDAAESITSTDNTLWSIKLVAGNKFTDGTPVTSDSFIKAWQYAASDPRFENQWWFTNFEGYNDGGSDAKNPTVVDNSLSLKKVDDTTFTVQLAAPQSDFPQTLGYIVFAPLPESFFADPAAFGANPVGNGPYKFDSWTHDIDIKVSVNPDYNGPRKAQNNGIDFVVYQTQDASYADLLSDNVDLVRQVPAAALGSFESDLGSRAINQAAAIWQGLTIPQRLKHFSGQEGNLRRQAISLAINRDDVTSVVFNKTRTPAVDFTSPVIDGFNDNLTGSDVLKWTDGNPAKAQALWAQADAISKWDGKFQIAYNADGGHKAWVDAVTAQIKNVLGIDAEGLSYPDFASLRADIKACRTGSAGPCNLTEAAMRSGWQFDYPGAGNVLGALYLTGAGSNDGEYSNPDFDKLVKEAPQAKSIADANALYAQAQEVLLKDLPTIPLWYQGVQAGYSKLVSNVQYGWDTWPILYQVTKSS